MRFGVKIGVFFLLVFTVSVCVAEKKRAFFSKPVVNLISHRLGDYAGFERFLTTYSPESKNSCLRTFQGLFGEMVFIDDNQNPSDRYVQVEMCHCFFADRAGGARPLFYWAKRDDLLFFDQLSEEQLQLFPRPIFYEDATSVDNPDVVVLAAPWTSKQTGMTYSVGTRFLSMGDSGSARLMQVIFFDPFMGRSVTEKISTRLLVNHGLPIPVEQKRKAFVKLLKKWCKNKKGIVPYVWGGASSLSRFEDENFVLAEEMIGEQKVVYWTRKDGKVEPDGFDCSGLVLRAAQACGIPYFCRTAGTAAAVLTPLVGEQGVAIGDLFVTEGHNHIFAAAGRDTIIEAAGYSSGFACVHRISVKDRFLNAQSYAGLVKLFREHRVPVYRCKDGKVVTPTGFVVLKLPIV